MLSKESTRRLEEICEELMELVDNSRAHSDNDECELLCCIVHDSVQKMQRAMAQLRSDESTGAGPLRPESSDRPNRIVN